MKKFLCALFMLIAVQSTSYANGVYAVYPVPQPVPTLQIMVYQAPAYTVMVPVVVNPIVVEQRTVWTYPYHPVTIPINQYQYWGYDKRCRLIKY